MDCHAVDRGGFIYGAHTSVSTGLRLGAQVVIEIANGSHVSVVHNRECRRRIERAVDKSGEHRSLLSHFDLMRERIQEACASSEINNLSLYIHEEDIFSMEGDGRIWDDAKGGWLDAKMVAQARDEELRYIRQHQIYKRVPRSKCYAETGRPPIKTGWVDTNKGSHDTPNIRPRWVAKEINTRSRMDLFAATSPL